MAAPRRVRRREAQIGFEALSIEGGLLSADWPARVAQLSAGGQTEADYAVLKGLNLRDEIGRYWRIAQAHWTDFAAGRTSGGDPKALAERFVLGVLRDSFGFVSLQPASPIVVAEWSYPIGFAALGGRVPVVIAPAASGLDSLTPAASDGARRSTAFGLTQEFLNAADGAMWGLATDGMTLRIVRDNASLTRPAWIEADLSRIFTEERYSDFAALWLLAHESRFGRAEQAAQECPLETWRNAGREEGTRAREFLRRGVEDALVALGQGFLGHPSNQNLRAALHSGELTAKEYFNQLLRLVYRIIFLLTVEERDLLHPKDMAESARKLYEEGYSLKRLRERSAKRSAHDRFSDLWDATMIVFRGVATGEPRLALPALAGIFAKSQCPALEAAKLENRALLLATFRLSWLREDSGLARVNWRDMGPEELGSVYESLLELVPQITQDGRRFAFATGGETKGNARKTTGSYYTHDSLVQELLNSALDPVIAAAIAAHPEKPVEALLQLSIVDSACGSGHFLLAAARRVADQVARLRAGGTPSPAEYRHALREVIGHCIYGVDLNPMAVELCRVGLWLEAVEPGKPLSFLDHHIRVGNSLLGTTPELIAAGLPDEAFDPIEGDDKDACGALKKRNKEERGGQMGMLHLMPTSAESRYDSLAEHASSIEAAADDTLDEMQHKSDWFQSLLVSPEYRHEQQAADAWCSAFVWVKRAHSSAAPPTTDTIRRLQADAGALNRDQQAEVASLSGQYQFFHWHLAFPEVFKAGGFDCVLGNPPWDKIQPEEEKFFAATRPDIANAASAKVRKALIEALPNPVCQHE